MADAVVVRFWKGVAVRLPFQCALTGDPAFCPGFEVRDIQESIKTILEEEA